MTSVSYLIIPNAQLKHNYSTVEAMIPILIAIHSFVPEITRTTHFVPEITRTIEIIISNSIRFERHGA